MSAHASKPPTLCMAPWVHTYLSPQTERRMCCASSEPAQNFQQYIDSSAGTGTYIPITLEEHWNSDHMKSVRRRMMAGETLPECEVCNDKLLNTDVYRSYFTGLFGHKYEQAMAATDATGHTTLQPISWDYRFSNLCNFKCRMCGDMLSSSWEVEAKQTGMIEWEDPRNFWMKPENRLPKQKFQESTVDDEFSLAVEQHRIEEVYWVGGEPLMYEQHWRFMKRIIELGDGPKVYARYNTNLSRVQYRGVDLFRDILCNLRDWQICASIDGTGKTGEYIRTGLNYAEWLENFKRGVAVQRNPRQMRLDFTLTLPGLFEVENMQALADELGVGILAKVVFSFTNGIILSPLSLPRPILERKLNELMAVLPNGALRQVIEQLKTRPTFQEQWPDDYLTGWARGKSRILQLEQVRKDSYTMSDILKQDKEIHDWWQSIAF